MVPTHNIPFSRDPQFVERQELVELQSRLSIEGARLALVGIGGIGQVYLQSFTDEESNTCTGNRSWLSNTSIGITKTTVLAGHSGSTLVTEPDSKGASGILQI